METPDKFLGWTEDPISVAWENFELCYECKGNKLCSVCGGSGCGWSATGGMNRCSGNGWCIICGGAGQWPVDPKIKYFHPGIPLINLKVVAEEYKVKLFKANISEEDFMIKLKMEPDEKEIYKKLDESGNTIYFIGYKNPKHYNSAEECWEVYRKSISRYGYGISPLLIQEPFKTWWNTKKYWRIKLT